MKLAGTGYEIQLKIKKPNIFSLKKLSMTFLKSRNFRKINEKSMKINEKMLIFRKFQLFKNVIEKKTRTKILFEKTVFCIVQLYLVSNLCKCQRATPNVHSTNKVFVLDPLDFGEVSILPARPSYGGCMAPQSEDDTRIQQTSI